MKKLFLLSAIVVFGLGLIFFGCKKKADDLTNVDNETKTAVDNEVAESAAKDAGNMCAAAYKAKSTGSPQFRISGEQGDSAFAKGVTIVLDTMGTAGQNTLTCNFGLGIVCGDGVFRAGSIIASWNTGTGYQNAVKSILFSGYLYRGYKVTGNLHLTPPSASNSYTTSLSSTRIALTKANDMTDTTVITSLSIYQTLLDDRGTPNIITDNIYLFTGGVTGKSKTVAYSTTIDPAYPLYKDMQCEWIKAGKIKFQISGKSDRVLDFGSKDTCDALGKLYIAGTVVTVTFAK